MRIGIRNGWKKLWGDGYRANNPYPHFLQLMVKNMN